MDYSARRKHPLDRDAFSTRVVDHELQIVLVLKDGLAMIDNGHDRRSLLLSAISSEGESKISTIKVGSSPLSGVSFPFLIIIIISVYQ